MALSSQLLLCCFKRPLHDIYTLCIYKAFTLQAHTDCGVCITSSCACILSICKMQALEVP